MFKDVLIHLIDNPKAAILVFLFLLFLQAAPGYMAWRVESAVDRLTDKIECDHVIRIRGEVSSK